MVVLEVAVALVMAEEDVEADEDGPGSGVVREPERADERRDDKPARYRFNKYSNNSNRFLKPSPCLPVTNRLEINGVMCPTLQVGAVSLCFGENIQDALRGEIHFGQDVGQRIG